MTPDQVQQLIISTFNNMGNAQQFGVSKIPAHTHNGIDSPRINDVANGNMNSQVYDPAGIAQQLVGTTATQTVSNKTLTSVTIPQINGSANLPIDINAGFYSPYKTDTDAGTITFDVSVSNVHTVTLGGSRTLAVTNAAVGQCFVINLVQDGTGTRTVTWFSTIKWPSGVTPTLTTSAGSADSFGFTCISAGNYYGFVIGQAL